MNVLYTMTYGLKRPIWRRLGHRYVFSSYVLILFIVLLHKGSNDENGWVRHDFLLSNFILTWTNNYLQTLTMCTEQKLTLRKPPPPTMTLNALYMSACVRPLIHHHHHYNDPSTCIYYHYMYTAINNNRCPYDENGPK